jgi:hypothetical protein
MWHFGYDSPSEYTGEKFEVAWEDGQNALFRIYTKDLDGVSKSEESVRNILIKDSIRQ